MGSKRSTWLGDKTMRLIDVKIQLANTDSEYSELPADDNEEEDEEETTLYFDAEEGRLAMPDGTTLEIVDDDEEIVEEDAIDGEGGEGSRTPQATTATATGAQRDPQTVTSTYLPAAPAPERRPSRLRRASSATQRRVSSPHLLVL